MYLKFQTCSKRVHLISLDNVYWILNIVLDYPLMIGQHAQSFGG